MWKNHKVDFMFVVVLGQKEHSYVFIVRLSVHGIPSESKNNVAFVVSAKKGPKTIAEWAISPQAQMGSNMA